MGLQITERYLLSRVTLINQNDGLAKQEGKEDYCKEENISEKLKSAYSERK